MIKIRDNQLIKVQHVSFVLALLIIFAIISLKLIPEVEAQGPGVWIPTDSLATARHSHTSTRLSNDTVLVAGGTQGNFEGLGLVSTEIFDTSTNSWSQAAPLNQARQSHTATLLPGGEVLVASGRSGTNFLSSMELYDPTSNNWSLPTSLNEARTNHAAVLLNNGHILIIGGVNSSGNLASVEVFNPADNTIRMTTPMNSPRNAHTAIVLNNNRVLVIGGFNQGWLSSAELFDPVSETWTTLNPLYCHGVFHTVSTLLDGSVLVAGGACGSGFPGIVDKAEIYNPVNNTWQAISPLPARRHAHRAITLPDGNVLVVGGADGQARLTSAVIYNVASNNWTPISSLNVERRNHTATLLKNNSVLVAGGWRNTTSVVNSAELLVRYNFNGFFPPVNNPPTLNEVKAGKAIPIKFSLDGDQGLDILAEGYPKAHEIACDTLSPTNEVAETVDTTGNSKLSYDLLSDQYIFVWKTNKDWAGTCRQLNVRLNDNSDHIANFEFK